MTKICPWKRGTYFRMPRRSVGLIVVAVAEAGVGCVIEPGPVRVLIKMFGALLSVMSRGPSIVAPHSSCPNHAKA
jgi:hypothetical protein